MNKPTPKRRDRNLTLESDARERILQAALSAFSERGFEGASTREIAAEAGVAQGLLTYHFSSKQALWEASVDWAFGALAEAYEGADEMLRDLDPQTRLRALMKRQLRLIARHPEVHRLMMHEGSHDGPRLHWIVNRHLKPIFALGERYIRDALPLVEMVHFQYALIGAMSHFFAVAPEVRLVAGADAFAPDTIEQHATIIDWLIDGALVQQAALERKQALAEAAFRA
jgi:TetR/AcrR family transcriptional regulator